ncbi:hypothetical protein SAMN05421780_101760 [Flexibacter flexilis DSM 6793]|uniref:Dolichyl-phosphate-mannose-protein mannosyltransferase n=1 Tax=Flexibacter flexilis DSM 6793 TaxID=927664 RepID=A0A1I1EIF8_9BACT|nr:hypothetical protein [Flexibacter flexilis]SFB85208.1 hypothetical protein SAMN05421780_101760 [Flexibacter flexilis DSM 6793]
MLRFFRINVPDRIIVLFLLLLAIRLPLFITGTPHFAPELQWLLIGEKLSKGFLMYKDVWDNTAPFSAFLYMLLNYIAGKSVLALQILAFVVLFVQALLFNEMGVRQELYTERTFVPALVYGIGASFFYDCLSLSPMLLGITFLLLALSKIFRHIRYGIREDEIFLIGFYIGIAALFKLSLTVFVLFPMVVFLLYSGTSPRLYALLLLGFFITFAATFLIFLGFGAGSDFYYNYLATLFASYRSLLVGWREILPIAAVPLIFGTIALFKVVSSNKFINYQIVSQVAMIFWVVFSVIALWLDTGRSPFLYLIFLPALAFLLTHFFLLFKKKWQAELAFLVWSAATVFMLYIPTYKLFEAETWLPLRSFEVGETLPAQANQNKNILVLGYAPEYYVGNSLATPYLNYELSRRDLHDLEHYSSVLRVYNNFRKELPDIIVKAPQDPTLDLLFARMPVLAKQYQQTPADTNVYQRITQ